MSSKEQGDTGSILTVLGGVQAWFVVAMVLVGGVTAQGFWDLISQLHGGLLSPWAGQPAGPYGMLAAAPLLGSRLQNRRKMALAVFMVLIILFQALAGSAAAVLLLSHWWPMGPENSITNLAAMLAGTVTALPTIIATHRRLRRKVEAGGDTT
ncbi:MAG: hypothetical protein IMF05_03400 [Proteobacteria bacterium]|nr:hypothetical protein [Pseudomonadota bacterium]